MKAPGMWVTLGISDALSVPIRGKRNLTESAIQSVLSSRTCGTKVQTLELAVPTSLEDGPSGTMKLIVAILPLPAQCQGRRSPCIRCRTSLVRVP